VRGMQEGELVKGLVVGDDRLVMGLEAKLWHRPATARTRDPS
jgi:hypothetical protein